MRGSLAYACMTGVVGVFCTGAWAQTPVFSVRLGGYTPNTYGQCRPINGFDDGTGSPCTENSECTVGAEFCGQMFRDISCPGPGTAGDDHCLATTGGPSKCVETATLVGTSDRCSAISDAPQGMIQPGDTVFLEVWADEWDQIPDVGPNLGMCENGINDCEVGEPEQCKSCHDLNEPPGDPCTDNADCTGAGSECRQDTHCEFNGITIPDRSCDSIAGAQCGTGRDCVADECEPWPTVFAYQWHFDSSAFSNHGPASALIAGSIPCTSGTQDDDCRHGYKLGCTTCSAATCLGVGTCGPKADAFVYTTRLDFLFANLSPVVNCSTATKDYSCGGVLQNAANAVVDTGSPGYLGTAALTVSDGACGTFTVDLIDDDLKTFIRDAGGVSVPNGVTTNPARITMSPTPTCLGTDRCNDDDLCTDDVCNCDGFCLNPPGVDCPDGFSCNPTNGECEEVSGCELTGMTSTPADCSIDPGIPHSIGSTAPSLGWRTIDLEFATFTGCDTSALTTGHFSVEVTPALTPPDEITVLSVSGTGSTATVTLSEPIPAQHWVCLTHDGPASLGVPETTCLGALPADSDANQVSESADIAAVIDCLVSGGCEVWKCDIDRLGACTGADVEETVNLLNGAGEFIVWDGEALLPACPAP